MKKMKGKPPDFIIFFITLVLVGLGLVMVFSASAYTAGELRGDGYFFLKRQAYWAFFGLIAMVFLANYDYRKLKKYTKLALIINFVLLALVYVPGIGVKLSGASRWIGIMGYTIQPSEFTKLALILFAAAFLSRENVNVKKFWIGVVPLLAVMGASFLLILKQPDLGTAIAIAGTVMVILFVAGMEGKHFFLLGITGLPLLGYLALAEEYRRRRFLAFLDPWEDPLDTGYHIIQSLYALGPGRLFGVGLGRSRQKFFYLPEPHSDFVFAMIGEELGFIGGVTVIFLFFLLIWRGFKLALMAPDMFGSLLASGIVSMIAIQVVINIGVVTGSIPVTGINLPFISAGGSSLFFMLSSIGVLLNISKYSQY
ncbi:stage V sporulation protein E [Candidatus Contubernalis alkaliaceticus]|uniref:stage V sporulation protein E n=1 Tax=Candidatus Contubernalis alkaliaceticus TaxID=338645 RepID=UPI001F4C48DC|nr:stage V sporulation protein E [Candidatus Contubernalis alkalaceticus]UNC92875.1 stage V sporulation protein E [Candidatus Contubernalis alkalaceticus]